MIGYKHLIQRDSEIIKIEQLVFGQMEKIYEQVCPKDSDKFREEIKFVSFEDALKELVNQKSL